MRDIEIAPRTQQYLSTKNTMSYTSTTTLIKETITSYTTTQHQVQITGRETTIATERTSISRYSRYRDIGIAIAIAITVIIVGLVIAFKAKR